MRAPITEEGVKTLHRSLGILPQCGTGRKVTVDGVVYESLSAGCREIGVSPTAFRNAINCGRKCKGHTVAYV